MSSDNKVLLSARRSNMSYMSPQDLTRNGTRTRTILLSTGHHNSTLGLQPSGCLRYSTTQDSDLAARSTLEFSSGALPTYRVILSHGIKANAGTIETRWYQNCVRSHGADRFALEKYVETTSSQISVLLTWLHTPVRRLDFHAMEGRSCHITCRICTMPVSENQSPPCASTP